MAQQVKNPSAVQETQEMQVWSLGQEGPLEKELVTYSNILVGKSHGQRSLAGQSSWSHKESDTKKQPRTMAQWHTCFQNYPFQRSNWRRRWHPTPVLLPGKSHGRRSLEGCSPWGHWLSDTTERLHFHFSLSCIGEGNGNPLQCSCLENARDGGPGGLPSMGSHGVRHDWSDLAVAAMFQSPSNQRFIL